MCCLTMCLLLPRFGSDPKQAEQGALLEAAAESQRLRERLEGLLKEVRSCHISPRMTEGSSSMQLSDEPAETQLEMDWLYNVLVL